MLLTTVDQELLQAVAVNRPDFCLFTAAAEQIQAQSCETEAVLRRPWKDGLTQEELFEFTNIDPWFLSLFAGLHQARCPLTLGCHT